jgi:hypothetical protein
MDNAPSELGQVNFLAILIAVIAFGIAAPASAEWTHLQIGKTIKTCQGQPKTFKISSAEPWKGLFNIAGLVDCADTGEAYVYTVRYINVVSNAFDPRAANLPDNVSLKGAEIHFAQIGFAVYRPSIADGIEWISDEIRPIEGTMLLTLGSDKISFGGFRYVVAKRNAARATNMLFYISLGDIVVEYISFR